MKVPAKFPDGCEFVADSELNSWVKFPDGSWFKLEEDGTLGARPNMDSVGPRNGFACSEASLLKDAATLAAAA